MDGGQLDQDVHDELQQKARRLSRRKCLLLLLLVAPVVLLAGLIATNGFTEATPGVIVVGLLIGLVVIAPVLVPGLLLLFFQSRFADNQRWKALWIVGLLLTVIDVAAILMLAQWAFRSLTPPAAEEISMTSVALSLTLIVIMALFARHQFDVARSARHRDST